MPIFPLLPIINAKMIEEAKKAQANKDVSTAMGADGSGQVDISKLDPSKSIVDTSEPISHAMGATGSGVTPGQTGGGSSGGGSSSSGGGGGSSGGGSPGVARPADVPVRNTSQDNAETIAQRYRDRGYNARVVDQGDGKFAVHLTEGSAGYSPISTDVGSSIGSMPSIMDQKVEEEKDTTPSRPTIRERTVTSTTRDGSDIKIMGWRTTNENEIYRVIKDEQAVSDFFYDLHDATKFYIKGLNTGFSEYKPKILEEKKEEETLTDEEQKNKDLLESLPAVSMENLTYRIPGYDEKGYPIGSPGMPDVPKPNILYSEVDKGVTGGTARPKDLPWTFEGAREDLSMGGNYAPSLDEILRKAGTYEFDETQRDLKTVHDVGTDEKGDTIWVQESPYQILHDYTPNDPDFKTIKDDIKSKLTGDNDYDATIDLIQKNVDEARSVLPGLKTNLQTIRDAEEDTKWKFGFNETQVLMQNPETYDWIKENVGFKNEYSSNEAEKILEHFISKNESVVNQEGIIGQLKTDKKSLEDSLHMVEQYEKLGYEVDITDEGYKFHLPSEEEVHKSLFGDKEGIALSATAFMESPLAIKTIGSAIWQGISGDKKVGETRKKELISYSLGLSGKLKTGGLEAYAGEVLQSPAMVQGVYLPALAYGGGYALTGLSAGGTAGGAIGSSVLSKVGSTAGGQLISNTAKIGMIGVGTYGVITTGQHLYTTSQERPEALAGEVAETAFTFGMAYAGFKGGQKAWTQRHTGSWQYNWKTGKAEWSPKEMRKMDIRGIQDVLEYKFNDKSVFTAEGMQKIGGKDVNIQLHGIGEPVPGKDISMTHGYGKMSWTEKGKWGAKIDKVKWFDFKGAGKEFYMENLSDNWRAFSQISKSKFLSGGEPTTARGTSLVRDWGDLYFYDKGVRIETPLLPKEGAKIGELPTPTKQTTIYSGSYHAPEAYGRQFQLGRTISFKIGGDASGGTVGGGGSVSQLDYGQIFGNVGSDAVTMFAQDTSLTPLGGYSGIGGLGGSDTPTIVKADTTHATKTTTTTPVADTKISGSPGGVVLVGIPKVVETKQDQKTDQDYFTKTDVVTGSGIGTGSKSGQKVMTTQILEPVQEVKTDIIGEKIDIARTELGHGNILDPDAGIKSETDILPGTIMGETMRQDNLFEPGVSNIQEISQMQSQKLSQASLTSQKLKLAQKTALEEITVTTPVTVTTPPPPKIVTPKPPYLPDDKDEKIRRKAQKQRLTKKPKIMKGEQDKGLLSDLLSVTVSHARFGKATHPKVTKTLRKKGAKRLYSRVPTKELMKQKKEKKKKEKPNLLKRRKNVLY